MQIDALFRYPVKSMGGERLDHLDIASRGVVGDRRFAVVDEADGKVASAKNPRKWGGLLQFSADYPEGPDGAARITFPDGSVASSDDADIHHRLSRLLERPVRLSEEVPDAPAYEAEWPDVEGVIPPEFLAAVRTGDGDEGGTMTRLEPKHGSFLDFAAVHLLATATLEHLSRLAPDSRFDVRRYRPNVVVGGADGGFVENGWTSQDLRAAEVVLRPIVPTMRCIMTTLPQGDLPRDPATLRTVAAHNRIDIPGAGVWSCVGLYAEVVSGGALGVGDRFAA